MRPFIINFDRLKDDIASLLRGALSAKERAWFAKVYTREVLRSRSYTPALNPSTGSNGAPAVQHVVYAPPQDLKDRSRYILDWLAELQQRDPRLHEKLGRINFNQAYQHAEKWHQALARAAERSERYVTPDEKHAPKVLDLGHGWEVFWLRTNLARDIEGEVMGHCLGSGAYDDPVFGEGVFSIRKNNISHITLHLSETGVKQAVTKGNGEVPKRYQGLLDEARGTLMSRFHVHNRPDVALSDGMHMLPNGATVHARDGKIHRDGGPAFLGIDGSEKWFRKGLLHREDGPALINPQRGEERWFFDGELHREGGPAVILADGRQEWWVKGLPHRTGGPAMIYTDGTRQWWKHGALHREDGPAITREVTETPEWCQNGKQQREDGSAIERRGAVTSWWLNGQLHREDGPAVIHPDGRQEWYLDGNPWQPISERMQPR